MENKNKIPQPEDKAIYKDYSNTRMASVPYSCAGDWNYPVNLSQGTYLELVRFESKVYYAKSAASVLDKNITGNLDHTTPGAGKITVYDVGAGGMSPNETIDLQLINFSNVKINADLSGILPEYYLRGRYTLTLKNQTGNQLGSLYLPLNTKIKKPHIIFHYGSVQTLTFSILNSSFLLDPTGIAAGDLAMLMYLEFREYPDNMYRFAQQGRIYI